MVNAVLKHRNARGWAAKARQPSSRRRGVLRLGAKEHPIDRRCRGRVGHASQFNFYGALGALQRETFEPLADAGDDIMPVGSTEGPGRHTTNAAQADHGDGAARLGTSPNTWGNRSIIHYGSVKQRPVSVKRGGLAVRSSGRALLFAILAAYWTLKSR